MFKIIGNAIGYWRQENKRRYQKRIIIRQTELENTAMQITVEVARNEQQITRTILTIRKLQAYIGWQETVRKTVIEMIKTNPVKNFESERIQKEPTLE